MVLCYSMMSYVDYSMMYHLIRGQSVIKLYIIYNMLEVEPHHTRACASASSQQLTPPPPPLCCQVADRLFSSFGQDILDALYWTATEPKEKKRAHIGVIPHFLMAVLYVCILTESDRLFLTFAAITTCSDAPYGSLTRLLCSPPRHPHHGSGHHSQCSLQLPQQVPAHHHDVKQRKSGSHAPSSHLHCDSMFCSLCLISLCSLWRSKEACSRSLKRTTCFRCRTAVSDGTQGCV